MNPKNILSLDDFEEAARRHLPKPVFAYVHGGVEENLSRDDNRRAFEELGFFSEKFEIRGVYPADGFRLR